jgi:preprotein translocase subunit YajC
MTSLIPIVILFGLMYVLLIRPQQQRVRRQRELISSLDVGDSIVTDGGIMGTILELDDTSALVEVSDGVRMRFIRPAISRKVEPLQPAAADEAEDASDEPAELPESPDTPEVDA